MVQQNIYGVNLGGWLVLEKWITPSVFEYVNANDELEFCKELGENADETLAAHRKTFITYEDFKWIRDNGFNTVRIPVPHWWYGDVEPYIGCKEYLDFAMTAALEHSLMIILDLHTAPGSQNGHDHSGAKGPALWHTNESNIASTLSVLDRLCSTYGNFPNLIGIELLNEPDSAIPHRTLMDFYKKGYAIVRKYCPDNVAVIFSDAYRPMDWSGAFDATYKNIVLDMHLYQAFTPEDTKMSMHDHIEKALHDWKNMIREIQTDIPVLVGEWSLGLDNHALDGHDPQQYDLALKAYAAAQIDSFKQGTGWCFWTYKTENMAGWSAVDAVNHGWLHVN